MFFIFENIHIFRIYRREKIFLLHIYNSTWCSVLISKNSTDDNCLQLPGRLPTPYHLNILLWKICETNNIVGSSLLTGLSLSHWPAWCYTVCDWPSHVYPPVRGSRSSVCTEWWLPTLWLTRPRRCPTRPSYWTPPGPRVSLSSQSSPSHGWRASLQDFSLSSDSRASSTSSTHGMVYILETLPSSQIVLKLLLVSIWLNMQYFPVWQE